MYVQYDIFLYMMNGKKYCNINFGENLIVLLYIIQIRFTDHYQVCKVYV